MTVEQVKEMTPEVLVSEFNALNDKLTATEKELAEAKSEADDLLAMNTELQEQLATLQDKTKDVVNPTVEHDGKKYEVTVKKFKVKVNGNLMDCTSDTLKDNPEAIAVLIKRGSSILKAV